MRRAPLLPVALALMAGIAAQHWLAAMPTAAWWWLAAATAAAAGVVLALRRRLDSWLPLAALLYQGGYLTISEVIDDTMLRLGIPNNEIANSLSEGYVSSMLGNALPDWNEQLAEVRADARTRF